VAQQGAVAFIELGRPTKWAQGHTRARRELGVRPRVRPGQDARWGMTGGPHLAAAEASWAGAGPTTRPGCEVARATANRRWSRGASAELWQLGFAREQEKGEGRVF
jgi:hypothetical protein